MTPDLAQKFSLAGRRALITGASGALGQRFATVLSGAGASVALAARRVAPMEKLAATIRKTGGTAVPIAMDLTDPAQITKAFETAETVLDGPIDILINNSGIASPGRLLDQANTEWAAVMAVNLEGARRAANEAARRLVAAKQPGTIVNVASILGLRQGAAVAAYATSKAALIQLTKQQALEWARYLIRVNALAPGYIKTDINRDHFATEAGKAQINRIPQRQLGRPEDLDGPILLLASDAGAFMTGSVLVADGGHVVSPL